MLFADGLLCGSTVNERVLTTVWSVPVGEHLSAALCTEGRISKMCWTNGAHPAVLISDLGHAALQLILIL